MQLTVAVAPGNSATPQIVNPDGSQSPFSIPKGSLLTVTDISIQRESVVATPGLFNVALAQEYETSNQLRWAFVGSSAENIERTFKTGIEFSTPFLVQNGTQLGDAVVVRLWGFIQS